MSAAAFPDACILIVDDEPTNVLLLASVLESGGYTRIHTASEGRDALARFDEAAPDIVLLDLHMPDIDGMQLMRCVREKLAPGEFLPMVMLTADLSPEVRQRALAEGAMDFLTKPFDFDEVLLRIGNLLTTRRLHLELRGKADDLEERVRARTAELEQARVDILDRLARAADFRDDATGEHTRRVGALVERIALELGIPAREAARIGRAAMLHDLGKIGVPDGILLKAGPLSPGEFELMRLHTTIGREILDGSPAPLLQVAAVIAHTHHERWDGGGYHGMAGTDIPLAGRIVTVADSWDAIVSDRPYRRGSSRTDAIAIMRDLRGTQFDPDVLDAFLRVIERDTPADQDAGSPRNAAPQHHGSPEPQ
jgi:putative two-component system response regulator